MHYCSYYNNSVVQGSVSMNSSTC